MYIIKYSTYTRDTLNQFCVIIVYNYNNKGDKI